MLTLILCFAYFRLVIIIKVRLRVRDRVQKIFFYGLSHA